MLTSTEDDAIEIPLSKLKLTLLLLGSAAFVAIGIFFLINPPTFENSGLYHHRSKVEILAVGLACLIFFGAGVIVFTIKLFDKKPGLLINNEGITINPGTKSNVIKWENIERFEIKNISTNRFIMICLKTPEEYTDNLNPFLKKMALFNLKNFGSPVSITTNGLKCNTDELFAILAKKLNETQVQLFNPIKI